MSGGEITETEMTDEEVKNDPEMFALDEYLEKEERSLASEVYKFQEMQKERSVRARKKLENQVLIDMLKVANITIESQVEKYTEVLLCPMSLQLFRDPVFCIGDGHTYEKEMIEEWFKRNNISPKTGVELTQEKKVCVPNFAVRTVCDAIRKEKQPENRSSGIPTIVSSDEIINQLHDKISELNDELEGMYLQPIMNAADTYQDGYEEGREQMYAELEEFWKEFADFFESRGSLSVIYEQLRLFKSEVAGNYDWGWVLEDMEPTRACINSGREFPLPNVGGPLGVSETIRRTGKGINQGYCCVWKLWFENEEARDAFHAQLPPDHPIITGDINPSNRARLNGFPRPENMEEFVTPDVSRIRLSDLGGR